MPEPAALALINPWPTATPSGAQPRPIFKSPAPGEDRFLVAHGQWCLLLRQGASPQCLPQRLGVIPSRLGKGRISCELHLKSPATPAPLTAVKGGGREQETRATAAAGPWM